MKISNKADDLDSYQRVLLFLIGRVDLNQSSVKAIWKNGFLILVAQSFHCFLVRKTQVRKSSFLTASLHPYVLDAVMKNKLLAALAAAF